MYRKRMGMSVAVSHVYERFHGPFKIKDGPGPSREYRQAFSVPYFMPFL